MPGGLSLSVDKPCVVLMRENGNGLVLAVADPANRHADLVIEINRKLKGEGAAWTPEVKATRVKVPLPRERGLAGSSVVRELKAAE